MPVQETFYPALTALVSFPHRNLRVPIVQHPGQAVVQGRLSLNVCLRLGHCYKCLINQKCTSRNIILVLSTLSDDCNLEALQRVYCMRYVL